MGMVIGCMWCQRTGVSGTPIVPISGYFNVDRDSLGPSTQLVEPLLKRDSEPTSAYVGICTSIRLLNKLIFSISSAINRVLACTPGIVATGDDEGVIKVRIYILTTAS